MMIDLGKAWDQRMTTILLVLEWRVLALAITLKERHAHSRDLQGWNVLKSRSGLNNVIYRGSLDAFEVRSQ
eukprot:scaffold15175_cov82-Cyclotella_meneghiniana.AAC.8